MEFILLVNNWNDDSRGGISNAGRANGIFKNGIANLSN